MNLEKTLVLSIICNKSKNEVEKISKEKKSIDNSGFNLKSITLLQISFKKT